MRAKTVRGWVAAMNLVSVRNCTAAAACVVALGAACAALGWWSALPAKLPGDEVFNVERVAGLTVRALVAWPEAPDAPAAPPLAGWGLGLCLAGALILLAGFFLKVARSFIDVVLARHAKDVRLVVLDDDAAALIAAEPTAWTNLLVGDGRLVEPALHALHVPLDASFISATLPRIHPNIREVLALGADSSANVELVRRVIELRRAGASPRLDRLWIRIDPRELRTSTGRDGFADLENAAAEVRLVSLPEARCRCLLRDQPPNKARLMEGAGRAALVIIGLGETGLELFTRLCAQAQSPHQDPLSIVLVDTEAPAILRELLDLWPALPLVVELTALALEPRLPQSAHALLRHLRRTDLTPSCLYIALDDAALCTAWESELGLAVRLAGSESPLVLTVGQAAGSDRSLLIEEEEIERLQRQMHAGYLEHCGAGQPPAPARVPWSRLPFDYQEDNRSVADHLWTKVRDLDLQISTAPGSSVMAIEDSMIESMAAAEHRRWVASRAIAGWRCAETQSEAERTHPSMVVWADLPPQEREKDREVIRQIPAVLRSAGFSLKRMCKFSVASVAAGSHNEASFARALVVEARARAGRDAGALPHLVVAVDDARSFKLALQLIGSSDLAVSLVLTQPLSGLAASAGMSAQDAVRLGKAAYSLLIGGPAARQDVLSRWPALVGSAA